MTIDLPAPVAEWIGRRGPCGLCGGPDARHRVLDAIYERVTTGEPAADVATDYDVPKWVVNAVRDHWDWERQVWK